MLRIVSGRLRPMFQVLLLSLAVGPVTAAAEVPAASTAEVPGASERGASEQIASEKDEAPKWDVANPPGDWGFTEARIDVAEGTWMAVDV